MPLVSFVMSNYQTPPAYLRRALDSMLDQSLTDFEAVIVNDGVKDASYEALREYAARDSRIRLIENERNLGLPASLNKALGVCRGKYIARMDTDDICYPDRLAQQTAYMETHPEVMFAGAWADVFDEDEDRPFDQWRPVMCPWEEYRIRLLFSGEPLLIHPTVIFRSSFLEQNGLIYSEDPRYRYSEDYEFWTRCADHGAAGILERPVLRYRKAESGNRITVRHAAEMENCVAEVQKKLFARLGIADDRYDRAVNFRLLNGRKTYDIRYKKWMDLILTQNREKKIYDQKLMRRLFHDRWYNIVYYGTAYEKRPLKKLRNIISLYPDGYLRFFTAMAKRRTGKGHD